MSNSENGDHFLASWTSQLCLDAFYVDSRNKQGPMKITSRTTSVNENGELLDNESLQEVIAIESSKFFGVEGPVINEGKKPNRRANQSLPMVSVLEAGNLAELLNRPESFCGPIRKTHMPVVYERSISITEELQSQFDYNDPDLELKVSNRGIVVMGGTVKKLISLLSDLGFIEFQYITEFLGVFSYFTDIAQVLDSLREAYQNPQITGDFTDTEKREITRRAKKRVIFILKRWMETYPWQFVESNMVPVLADFINSMTEGTGKEDLMEIFKSRIMHSCESRFDFLTPRVQGRAQGSILIKKSDFLAKQLCIFDQKLYCKIEIRELKHQKWTKKNAFSLAPNVTRYISFFNRISYWCATEIVSQSNVKQRAKVVKRIICLAKRCAVYHNYNTTFALIGCLNFSAIRRLKKTWKALASKYMNIYKELDELCSVSANYFPYKKLLLKQKPPLVPYLGVYLRDLTFLEVGNPQYLDEEKQIVNYDKYRMIASVLSDFQKYQQIKYTFQPDSGTQTAIRYSMQTLDENQIYELSTSIEPPMKR